MELIYHLNWTQLLDSDFLRKLSIKEFIKTYSQMKETLRSHYYNLALPVSRFISIYLNSKSENEIKTDFNPFSKSDNEGLKTINQLDPICCSCLVSSVKSLKIPNWAVDLFDYNEIKSIADPLPRSDNRFFITNGMILIDPFFDDNYLYCPMGIFEKTRLEKKLSNSNNQLKLYDSNNQYLFDVIIDNDTQNDLTLNKFVESFPTILSNLKFKRVN